VSYLLGEHLAARMTFTTYSHRPGYSRHHLTGILSDALPPDADSSFQLFDLDAGKTPGGEVHPLAAILAGTGVMATEELWRQATTFASGAEEGPDDWLGPVTAAAGLLGRRLSASQTDTVARWLPLAARRMPAQHADILLGVALAQRGGTLSDERLLSMLELARELPSPSQVEQLEQILLDRAVTHITRGERAEPIQFTGKAGQIAQTQVSSLLAAGSTAALAVLDWAAASRVLPSDTELEWYGQTGLDLNTPERELSRLLSHFPAIRRGLVRRLASEPRWRAGEFFAGPTGGLISRDDLTEYAGLAEEWLLVSVDLGRMRPWNAFDQIVDIRHGPYLDRVLLERLWPTGCRSQDITDLLASVTKPPREEVLRWFVAEIEAAAARGMKDEGWLKLSGVLSKHPILASLPEDLIMTVRNAVRTTAKVNRADAAVRRGDVRVFAGLYDEYRTGSASTRLRLREELPKLLINADSLGRALRGCPADVMAAFCSSLQGWLSRDSPNAQVASRVFSALADPELQAQPELLDQLEATFELVRDWRHRDIAFLGQMLARDRQIAEKFRAWRESHRGRLARKLFGLAGPAEKRQGD
jgi:hypothetical protein